MLKDSIPKAAGTIGFQMGKLGAALPAWFLLLLAAFHAAYIVYPPAYYVRMHGGYESDARMVSVFAVVFFIVCTYMYEHWVSTWAEKSEQRTEALSKKESRP